MIVLEILHSSVKPHVLYLWSGTVIVVSFAFVSCPPVYYEYLVDGCWYNSVPSVALAVKLGKHSSQSELWNPRLGHSAHCACALHPLDRPALYRFISIYVIACATLGGGGTSERTWDIWSCRRVQKSLSNVKIAFSTEASPTVWFSNSDFGFGSWFCKNRPSHMLLETDFRTPLESRELQDSEHVLRLGAFKGRRSAFGA